MNYFSSYMHIYNNGGFSLALWLATCTLPVDVSISWKRMMTGRDVKESDEDIIDDDDEEKDLNILDEDDAFVRKQPNGKIRGKSSTLLSRRKLLKRNQHLRN